MSRIVYNNRLANEYKKLYKECEVNITRFQHVDNIVEKIIENRERYENVSNELNIPWYFIAAIHNMESSLNFFKHLHNGDPLTKRTVHVPENRPHRGSPPFSWEESAKDALKYKKLDKIFNWSLSRTLYELEKYNGWGYRMYHSHVLSPYLWSFSNHYIRGKYTYDGCWSEIAKSKQCGVAVIIRRLEEMYEIGPLDYEIEEPVFYYSDGIEPKADELQKFLNSFDGISLRVDSWPGSKTSKAVKNMFGFYLKDDPRFET